MSLDVAARFFVPDLTSLIDADHDFASRLALLHPLVCCMKVLECIDRVDDTSKLLLLLKFEQSM